MEKVKIKGMNCSHCAETVKKAIESVSGVKKVNVSLEKNEAEFETDEKFDINALKKAVAESGSFSAE